MIQYTLNLINMIFFNNYNITKTHVDLSGAVCANKKAGEMSAVGLQKMWEWILEEFPENELITKKMFGGLAGYYRGKMVFVVMESPGEKTYRKKKFDFEIWNGILFPTSREFHQDITNQFPQLVSHPVLGKWLYLPFDTEDFESITEQILKQILRETPQWGIVPGLKSKLKSKKNKRKKTTKK